MEQVYILQCEKNKYYVGKTTDVMRRYQEHCSGRGSAWTNKYKPLRLVECKVVQSPHDENNITKDYMKKYGVEHVRGGSYAQVVLPPDVVTVLQREFQGTVDTCYKCNLAGHFATNCPLRETPPPLSAPQGTPCACGKSNAVRLKWGPGLPAPGPQRINRQDVSDQWGCDMARATSEIAAACPPGSIACCRLPHVHLFPSAHDVSDLDLMMLMMMLGVKAAIGKMLL